MSFSIEKRGDQLLVRIADASREGQGVLDKISTCRGTSWWSCPTGECAKIGDCNTLRDGDATVLALTPRPGETLSPTGIEECLRYVLADPTGSATGKATPPAR
ncbi:MAG: hypothetical protein IT522_13530 [Burkholderiales bacterium]|nr:hypothetical protein [Burkholderiales bacterium]